MRRALVSLIRARNRTRRTSSVPSRHKKMHGLNHQSPSASQSAGLDQNSQGSLRQPPTRRSSSTTARASFHVRVHLTAERIHIFRTHQPPPPSVAGAIGPGCPGCTHRHTPRFAFIQPTYARHVSDARASTRPLSRSLSLSRTSPRCAAQDSARPAPHSADICGRRESRLRPG